MEKEEATSQIVCICMHESTHFLSLSGINWAKELRVTEILWPWLQKWQLGSHGSSREQALVAEAENERRLGGAPIVVTMETVTIVITIDLFVNAHDKHTANTQQICRYAIPVV